MGVWTKGLHYRQFSKNYFVKSEKTKIVYILFDICIHYIDNYFNYI